MITTSTRSFQRLAAAAVIGLGLLVFQPTAGLAQVSAFKQSVAEAVTLNDDLSAFYRANGFQAVWTGEGEEFLARRRALIEAISGTQAHGIPSARYEVDALMALMRGARTPRDLGQVDVALTRTFLKLAADLQTGILVPSKVDSGLKRAVPLRSPVSNMTNFLRAENPRAYFRTLPPQTAEYSRLMREKVRLEALMARGGWGPEVPAKALEPGTSGAAVVVLRNRLTAMGYLTRSASRIYDGKLEAAVQAFQAAHGLEVDGSAGPETIATINEPADERLKAVMVAMERERWLNLERGERHVLVNLTDFSARIIDSDKVTFQTRAVVGKDVPDRRTPEFSDEMEYMEINPVWNVPRSIAVKEYLPQMQRNRNAAGYLKLFNARGQEVSRANVNFGAYNARTFPFNLKQMPSNSNALGLVKFMFPNRYNIYLHDTPEKNLFSYNRRDFSHGCIRLQQPFEFAYALLARQEEDPKTYFQGILNTGKQTQVKLKKTVPVHIVYRTAFTQAQGPTQYRNDVYGRDGRIWDALQAAGVTLRDLRG